MNLLRWAYCRTLQTKTVIKTLRKAGAMLSCRKRLPDISNNIHLGFGYHLVMLIVKWALTSSTDALLAFEVLIFAFTF